MYILKKDICVNENVSSSESMNSPSFNVDGYYVESCPHSTVQVGPRCVPFLACKKILYRIDLKSVECVVCNESS